jgi:lipoyl(octanoyl) transferase
MFGHGFFKWIVLAIRFFIVVNSLQFSWYILSSRKLSSNHDIATRTLPCHGACHRLKLVPQQLGNFEPLEEMMVKETESHDGVDYQLRTVHRRRRRTVRLLDWSHLDPITFQDGWSIQKEWMAQHLDRLQSTKEGNPEVRSQFDGYDTIVFLQHTPVYTLGTGSNAEFLLPTHQENTGILTPDVVRMDRGGEVTYHGPGQLVMYLVLDLRGYRQDIHWYMRALEETVLIALRKAGTVPQAVREKDLTGIWIDGRKVAALGIKLRRWITQHGVAINVTPQSLENFRGIVPCGLVGREVTCVNHHVDNPMSVPEFAMYMKEALKEVFQIELEEKE